MINITPGTVQNTIPIGSCYGLDYYRGNLICCVLGKGILSVDLSNGNYTTLTQDLSLFGWCYCTVNSDKIYLSRSNHNTVTCYSLRGDKLWDYKDDSVFKFPVGIAVDNSSNLYIASYDKNCVEVLPSDRKRRRTLLNEKDGIEKPWTLHFDKSKNQLIVANIQGPVFLFEF